MTVEQCIIGVNNRPHYSIPLSSSKNCGQFFQQFLNIFLTSTGFLGFRKIALSRVPGALFLWSVLSTTMA